MDFVLINDVRQPITGNPRFIHHATVMRQTGLKRKEYCIFRDKYTNQIYMEEIVDARVNVEFKQIEDDNEFLDLARFAEATGLLKILDTGTRIHVQNPLG